jgi:hypothetical protein
MEQMKSHKVEAISNKMKASKEKKPNDRQRRQKEIDSAKVVRAAVCSVAVVFPFLF